MGKRKTVGQFLRDVDCFVLGRAAELSISGEFDSLRQRQIVIGLIQRIEALAGALREKKIKLTYGSAPGATIARKRNRKQRFHDAYQRLKSGRSHRGAVLLAAMEADVQERTAWKYVQELGLKQTGK
ncbi:MAG: hypothetical protein SFU86_07510 [Pirellulaceae bacterium]|nr:hypothetical protein [Pirellulaceae bacterium]